MRAHVKMARDVAARKCDRSNWGTAATGQVVSLEPRPTSTSRHPVLPRSRMTMPSSKNWIPAGAIKPRNNHQGNASLQICGMHS